MSAAVSVFLIKLISLSLLPRKMIMKFFWEFVFVCHYVNLCLRNDWLRNLTAVLDEEGTIKNKSLHPEM